MLGKICCFFRRDIAPWSVGYCHWVFVSKNAWSSNPQIFRSKKTTKKLHFVSSRIVLGSASWNQMLYAEGSTWRIMPNRILRYIKEKLVKHSHHWVQSDLRCLNDFPPIQWLDTFVDAQQMVQALQDGWACLSRIFISLRLMPPAFAGLEIASSMARSTTKSSSSNNSTILSIASSMARSTTKSNSNSSNNQQQQ